MVQDLENVLVTGGCGFIGANLVRFLEARTPWSLRVADDLRAGSRDAVPEGLAAVSIGDVGDPAVVEPLLEGAHAVIHLASETGVLPSVENPARDFAGNAQTTFRLLESCRRAGVSRFVFASSGAALGDVPPPLHEEVVPRPLSPYGAGKLAGEAYCQGYAGSFGMQTVVLRFSNVYGPFSAHKKNAVPNFIKRCLADEPIDIFGDGSQTRDFIYVEDLCEAILGSLSNPEARGEVIQLGTGVGTSILELAELTKQVTGSKSEIRFEERRAGEVYKSQTDISKARRLLGFEPQTSLSDGLAQTADWYREAWLPA